MRAEERRGSQSIGWRRCAALVLLVLLVLAAAACGSPASPAPRAHSAILITIDTLRADHLSSYGYARETSPALDALFARGVRFERAFSTCSLTAPSHTSLLTGRYPPYHPVGVSNGAYRLEGGPETLAERCRAAGLRTAAVVSNFVLSRRLGLDRGFEVYDDELEQRERVRSNPERIAGHSVDAALREIDRIGDERFFLWLHLQDPHGPYDPPVERGGFPVEPPEGIQDRDLPEGDGNHGHQSLPKYQVFEEGRSLGDYVRRYDEEIRYLDGEVERFLGELRERGLLERTVLAVTADHGESFGEEGFYCAHGQSLSPELTHVPLAVVGPGIEPGIEPRPVSNLLLFATLLDALGLEEGPVVEQSRSWWDALAGGGRAPSPSGPGFAHAIPQDAVFDAGLYLRRNREAPRRGAFHGSPGLPGRLEAAIVPGEQLHALDASPPDDPDRVARLRARLEASLERAIEEGHAARRRAARKLTPADEARLRALGYIE